MTPPASEHALMKHIEEGSYFRIFKGLSAVERRKFTNLYSNRDVADGGRRETASHE